MNTLGPWPGEDSPSPRPQRTAPTGSVVPPGSGRRIVTPALEVTLKIPGDRTEVGSLFEVDVPAGFDVGAHVHRKAEEFFYVVHGEVELFAFEPAIRSADGWRTWRSADGERVVRAGPGAVVHIPPGCPHAFANPGPAPAQLLFQAAPPPDHERYFEELQLLLRGDVRVSATAIEALRRRYDIEQLTPLRTGPFPS
ncbi:cupin domain-containing protein [Streptomyces sirii]|uniref:cupin domain-containing protein n=1 Tax=Streptomyces sirii TaxID=3127701 RepID=UPI003D37004C